MGNINNSDSALRQDVRLLGALLGNVISQQAGKSVFEMVEHVRTLSKGARSGNKQDSHELSRYLAELSVENAHLVARSFCHFLNLANIAEQHHRVRRRRFYQRDSKASPQPGSCEETFNRLITEGEIPDVLFEAISSLQVELVLTRHPTEIARRTLLQKHNRIASILGELDRSELTHMEREELHEALRGEITSIWLTDEVRSQRPTPIDEARTDFAFFEGVLWDSIPRFLRTLNHSLRKIMGKSLPIGATPIRFCTWTGGDRDGNPNVTPANTREVCLQAKWVALNLYEQEVHALQNELSLVTCNPELRERTGGVREPYRELMKEIRSRLLLSISSIEAKLEGRQAVESDVYHKAEELMEPLMLSYRSLQEARAEAVADGRLLDLIRRLSCFGLTLARLDLRQEADRHTEVMDSITESLGEGLFSDWSEEKRLNFLAQELRMHRSLLRPNFKGSERIQDVLDTFSVASELGPEFLGAYVISMAKAPSDTLVVELLKRQAGIQGFLPVVPLFETVEDLRAAGKTVRQLLSMPWYRSHIQGSIQIMIGYSDSAKDSGILSAAYELFKAQEDIVAVCQDLGVQVTLFHGRGGSVGRGGGPTYMGILAQPPGSVQGRLRVTQQGEVIQNRFGMLEIASRTLEIYTSASLQATLSSPIPPASSWRKMMENLSETACTHYRAVVYEDPRFISYFRAATPEAELDNLNLGSRPARRRQGTGLGSLRAIPWNFAWTQTRLLLPAWLGAGRAFRKAIDEGKKPLLLEMYRDWPFFRSTVDLIEMVLAKTDQYIASQYDEKLVPAPLQTFGKELRTQLADTVKVVLEITGEDELLQNYKELRRTIDVRNPYVDPLNLIQVEILRRLRFQPDDQKLRKTLLVTFNGIAAGLRNTG
jgi:phosphoenolpyruvate carboxylase